MRCMVRAWLAVGQGPTVRRAAQVEEHRAGRAAQLADKQHLAQQLQVPFTSSEYTKLIWKPADTWGAVLAVHEGQALCEDPHSLHWHKALGVSLAPILAVPASLCALALQAQQAADKEQQALQAAAARADKARRLEEQVAAQSPPQVSEQTAPCSRLPCVQVVEAQAPGMRRSTGEALLKALDLWETTLV